MTEVWKDIQGYEGLYKISNFGNIKSKSGIFKKQFISFKGYLRIKLSNNGEYKSYTVSRLVATAFIPNPENKPEVNHIDGNKLNNNISNLEWTTKSENAIHAFKNGLRKTNFKPKRGVINNFSKLTEEDVKYIRKNYIKHNGKSSNSRELANLFNVTIVNINHIVNRKTWKYIND